MNVSSWSFPAVFAALCIGAHYLALRAASGKIGDATGALLLEGTAALGVLVVLATKLLPRGELTSAGVFWSCLSGLFITGATTLMFVALRRGGPVSGTATLVLGGGVAMASLAAPFLYGETFTLRRGVGVALGLASMLVLSKS